MRRPWQAPFLALGVLFLPCPAAAQSSLQVPIQFDFLNPGARSLALGSAFVGLADDATAALVNPAGLIALSRPEISVEGRYRRLAQPFLLRGRLSGEKTGSGIDTESGPVFGEIADSSAGLGFLSFVYPRGRFRAAAFRHELTRLEQEFSGQGVFQNHGFENRDSALAAVRTLSIDTYGASAALERRGIWMGGGLLVQKFSIGLEFDRFIFDDFYGPPDPRLNVLHLSQDGDDWGFGAVAGVMVPVSIVKMGASYKWQPRFDYSSFSGGLAGTQQRTFATFKVPDVFSVGVSAELSDAFLVTTEYTYVRHSQVFREYIEVLTRVGDTRTRMDRFAIDDAHEFHLGAEYLLPFPGRPALRGGFWFDPDHSLHYEPTPAYDLLDERMDVALSSGKDLWHGTIGTMVAVHPRVDLNAAYDYSSRSRVFSFSAAIRF